MIQGALRLTTALLVLVGTVACAQQSTSAGSDTSSTGPSYNRETLLPELIAAVEQQGTVHGVVTADGVEARGDTVIGADPVEGRAALEMDLGGPEPFHVEVLHHGGWIYFRAEHDGKYLKVSPDDERLTPTMSGLHREVDPLAMLQTMRDAATSVEFVADENADGDHVEQYRVLVDYTKLDAGDRPLPPGYEEVGYDVYVDDSGLPDRLVWTTPQDVEMTHAFSDWGKQLEIAPPPDDQLQEGDTLSLD